MNNTKEDNMSDLAQMIKNTQEHGLYSTWQGSIHALEQLKVHIDFEIQKLKELQKSTGIGKTLNKIGA
tara:strand:+ start:300 stop:503 length:204 start_codon:yes stop_codon:yes gene_type:complete